METVQNPHWNNEKFFLFCGPPPVTVKQRSCITCRKAFFRANNVANAPNDFYVMHKERSAYRIGGS